MDAMFKKYAVFGRPGQDKDITSKNFMKMFKDNKMLDKKLNMTEIDMIFTKVKEKAAKTLTYPKFLEALKLAAKAKYGSDSDENVEKLKNKLLAGGGPSVQGTTKTSASAASNVERMTDTSQYTGSHKERFGDDGKGKGIDGRVDRHANTGYVGGYKDAGTFDKK